MPIFRRALLTLALVAGLSIGGVARAKDATPAQVDKAIKKAVDFLYSKQKNGNWEEVQTPPAKPNQNNGDVKTGQWGGLTAIATYALLAAGESPQDKRLQEAIEFLRKANITGVYAMGIRANVWELIPQNATVQQSVREDVIRLGTSAANHKPKGLYHYSITNKNSYDLSASQYGVLGMWALNQTGFDVPRAYWEWVDNIWKQKQRPDGGWAYTNGKDSTASMTAAGVATLFITQDYLYASAGINCQGNIPSPAIEKGLDWMGQHFKEVKDPYAWYGVERIGVASGYKYFGTTNWYQEGANRFVTSQSKEGAWSSHGAIPGTSFGILFLVRGRAPVVMNKLQYDVEQKGGKSEVGHWNERPRDVANVTKYIAKNLEKDLNWQIVNLKVNVEEFHDAPILYISGNQALNFTEEQETKLKQFVEQGGMIFANADCGSSGGRPFTQSFIKLGQKLFPYEFRELPADHVIYTREQFPRAKWRNPPSVQGLSNGVRELMLLVPTADPARTWQINLLNKGKDDLYQLMANIFLYAVDKGQGGNLRYKGETYVVNPDPKVKATGTLKVARLQYEGNWNPEPGGWRRLGAILHNDSKLDLAVDPVKLGEGKLAGHKVAHLTGTTKFTLPQAAKDELKKFVENGGLLVVDAAGGSSEFAQSAETLLSGLFPEHAQELKTPLKSDSLLYTLGGELNIEYRAYARPSISGSLSTGRLRAMTFGKRLGVVFSREDLSAGLVGEPVDGIVGYDPKTATQLMQNILLYAQNPNAAPPAAKAEKKEAAK